MVNVLSESGRKLRETRRKSTLCARAPLPCRTCARLISPLPAALAPHVPLPSTPEASAASRLHPHAVGVRLSPPPLQPFSSLTRFLMIPQVEVEAGQTPAMIGGALSFSGASHSRRVDVRIQTYLTGLNTDFDKK